MKKVDLLNIASKYSKDENYDFTGYLMYKDKAIAEIKDTNFIKSLEDNLLPIIMINKNIGAFESWLQTRVIDTNRTNINSTLKNFPTLEKEMGFNEIVFKIIKSNYQELLNDELKKYFKN